MAVETLRPDAAGNSTQWVPVGDTINWQMVDEESQDGHSTYNKSNGWKHTDLYNIEDHSAGSGTINKVTLYAYVMWYDGANYNMYIGVRSGATEDWGSKFLAETWWTLHTREFTTDPNTGSAWIWDAVDALQIGCKTEGTNGGGMVTQVYVEVDYTAAAGWTGKVSGVTNPAKVMGVAVANIAKVKGIS